MTPQKGKKLFHTASDTCCCSKETGSFMHIWWRCPPILDYWDKITKWIKHITDTKIILNAVACLLHINSFSISKYKKSLSRHLLTAAKTLITLHWKSTHTLTVKDWLDRVQYMYKMEKILVMKKENSTSFNELWHPWLLFTLSNEYQSLLS